MSTSTAAPFEAGPNTFKDNVKHLRQGRSCEAMSSRGMRGSTPLLLLAAWLGVCSAKGTICSAQPSVCSGTYSSSTLDLASRSLDLGNVNGILSGTIPTQLGALTALINLRFRNNGLSGSLPTQLGALTALQDLVLAKNELSGSLPTQLGASSGRSPC